MNKTFERHTIEHKGKAYPAVELYDFDTAAGYNVSYGVFTTLEFMDLNDDSLTYRIIDEQIYGYLPTELVGKATEEELREYIKREID